MRAKAEVLEFVASHESADSWTVAVELGYATQGGAAATLLRLYRHGHLRRRRTNSGAYVYVVSGKGYQWLEWWSGQL